MDQHPITLKGAVGAALIVAALMALCYATGIYTWPG